MPEATTVIETVEAVAPAVTPVIATGTLNYKKVAAYAAAGIVVAGCGYATYRIIKKRRAAKTEVIEVNPQEEAASSEPVEA